MDFTGHNSSFGVNFSLALTASEREFLNTFNRIPAWPLALTLSMNKLTSYADIRADCQGNPLGLPPTKGLPPTSFLVWKELIKNELGQVLENGSSVRLPSINRPIICKDSQKNCLFLLCGAFSQIKENFDQHAKHNISHLCFNKPIALMLLL